MNPLTDAMREAIEALIQDTAARLTQLERTLHGLHQRLELENHHLRLLKEKRDELNSGPASGKASEISIADYIAKMLMEKGEPMRPSEITEMLETNGVKSTSENGHMSAVLSALSRRTDMFQRVERGLYCLREHSRAEKMTSKRRKLVMASR